MKKLSKLVSLISKKIMMLSSITIFSPGRINLIGEHIDYSGGYVMPAAINKYIVLSLRRNSTPSIVRLYNKSFSEEHMIDLNNMRIPKTNWLKYIVGVIYEIQKIHPLKISGFDCTIQSDLSMGAGLGSSAALECGIGKGLNILFSLEIDDKVMIKLCQRAEHQFVGIKCGIMDQFSVYMAKKDHFILLHCATLQYKFIHCSLGDYKLLLLNTNVAHSLRESQYNQRREECETAFYTISKKFSHVKNLVNTTETELMSVKDELTENQLKRATFAIREQKRVLKTERSIRKNDIATLGTLMYESHEGLKELYDVSCCELNFLVDFSKKFEGVLGARMMGGGFGGATLNLIHKNLMESFIEHAERAYQREFFVSLSAIPIELADGTYKR